MTFDNRLTVIYRPYIIIIIVYERHCQHTYVVPVCHLNTGIQVPINIIIILNRNKSSAVAEKADRCVASWRADTASAKYPFPHSKFADYQAPAVI